MLGTMRIVLVRHAEAEPERAGLGDHGRALTPLGRQQAQDTAHWLGRLIPDGDRGIWTSPLLRATETAEFLAVAWPGATVQTGEALSTGRSVAVQLALVHGLPFNAGSALVGHEPLMSELAAALLGLPAFPMPFEKGAALVVRRNGKQLTFESYRAPSHEPLTKLA
jgi:phosphohistidine phosphatase